MLLYSPIDERKCVCSLCAQGTGSRLARVSTSYVIILGPYLCNSLPFLPPTYKFAALSTTYSEELTQCLQHFGCLRQGTDVTL